MNSLFKGISLLLAIQNASSDLVLSEKIMKLSKIAAGLSSAAYKPNPDATGFDSFEVFHQEPDQAMVAKKEGYCYGVFRGTTLTWDDWKQNLIPGRKDVCTNILDGSRDKETVCCTTRRGFFEAYNTDYRAKLEESLRKCAATCEDKDECIILTGHSQGGAIAAVAALYMPEMNPYVITFGQPPTLDAPCALVTSSRWYRYVNTKSAKVFTVGIVYDPVPFAPDLGTDDYGHMIMLSDDYTGVAYIGLDAQDQFGPLNINGFEAHSMVSKNGTYPGYLDRLKAVSTAEITDRKSVFPVRTTGYIPGSLCSKNKECQTNVCAKETAYSWSRCVGKQCKNDAECESRRCDSGVCVPKLGSCMSCDENSDCLYGTCGHSFLCSGPGGLLDDGCTCVLNTDCTSGRCEGVTERVCEARLALGGNCNENSDCISDFCSIAFRCGSGATRMRKWLIIASVAGVVCIFFCWLICGKGQRSMSRSIGGSTAEMSALLGVSKPGSKSK